MITGMDDFCTAITTLPYPLTDGRRVVAAVHQPTPGTNEVSYGAVYTVDAANHATLVGRSTGCGKVTGVAVGMDAGYGVYLYVTAPPHPGGGGAESVAIPFKFSVGARMDAIDQPARNQVNDATDIAKLADKHTAALDVRVDVLEPKVADLEARTAALEGV